MRDRSAVVVHGVDGHTSSSSLIADCLRHSEGWSVKEVSREEAANGGLDGFDFGLYNATDFAGLEASTEFS